MKRSGWLNRDPEKLRAWQRKPSQLSRSPLARVGKRGKRMRKEGTLFGDVFDWLMETVGTCQAKGELPGECGRLPGRKALERCHALTRNSGHYDWTTDPATGERVCNGLLMCGRHHDYADANKLSTLDWMRETARENGKRYHGAGG